MKKILLIILLVIITVTTYSQRIPAYKATNGKIYYEDDTITLNRGSMPDGSFKYLQMGDFYNSMAAMNGDYNKVGSSIGRNYSGLNVIIKKIKVVKIPGEKIMEKALKVKAGAMSAFGGVHKLPVVMDKGLNKVKKAVFSSGSFDHSIEMATKDFVKLENAVLGSFGVKKKIKKQKVTKPKRVENKKRKAEKKKLVKKKK